MWGGVFMTAKPLTESTFAAEGPERREGENLATYFDHVRAYNSNTNDPINPIMG